MDLLTLINNGMQNQFFDMVVPVIYKATGPSIVPVVLAILLILSWALKRDKIKKIILLCFFALFFTYVIVFALKLSYVSPRPYVVLSNIRMVCSDNGFNSFPSGHVAISMTVVSVILMKVKKHKSVLIVLLAMYMAVMAFTVMYAGVHYPSDVAAGLIVGLLSAFIAVFLSKRYLNSFFNI